MFEKSSAYIIGYSLDAALLARELAIKGKKVTFLCTGELGHPLDDINDYISYEDVLRIKSLHINTSFKKMINSTYAFIPYEQVKFVNNRNGLMSWPLNRSSFDSAEEWEQMERCIVGINDFRDKLDKATNYINIYKNFFPKWVYDTVIKHIGINKWGGFRQSKFSREGLAREINLSCLDGNSTGVVYSPTDGYKNLCEVSLEHNNITKSKIKLSSVRKLLSKRFKNTDVILMDNRVDEIFGYLYGAFDRVKWNVETTDEQNLEEFIDDDNGDINTRAYYSSSSQCPWSLISNDSLFNQNLRREFFYESSPSISLCLSIIDLISDTQIGARFLLHCCHSVSMQLVPDDHGRVNEEIDHYFTIG